MVNFNVNKFELFYHKLWKGSAGDHARAVGVTNSGHLMWSWMTAGVARLDKNPPSNPPSPDGDVARGVNPPSLPQKEEAIESPIGVIVPAGLEMETGVLLEYQTHWNCVFSGGKRSI